METGNELSSTILATPVPPAVVDRCGSPLGEAKGSLLSVGGLPPRKMVRESFPCATSKPLSN